MPTVILLDVSLSMTRPVSLTDSNESHTRLTIATVAINTFLDYLCVHAKLEYVALISFSSSHEVSVPFTRDYDSIRAKLPQLEEGDKTCIDAALLGVNQIVLNEWGYQTPVQIILVTDGNISVGTIGRSRIIQALPLPPTYPLKLHVLPVVAPHETCLQQAMPLYQKIVDQASNTGNIASANISRGSIYCPDQLTVPGVVTAMTRLCEQQYQEFWCTLKCGQLETKVQLFPAPQPASHDGFSASYILSQQLHVVGFLQQQDLGTPIALSKHLVIPQAQGNSNTTNRDNYGSKTPTKESSEPTSNEEDISDPSKVPNFCVLLHGALKVEGMSAIVQLGADWWGTLSAWCEVSRTRRSCLLLSILRPGASAAPWLGPLDQLGPVEDNATPPAETFPVRSWRSYSGGGSGCAWARPHALLADVQKVLRHARKLPDKTQHLYKELNRLRRAAISLGFSELLTCVGGALERECAALPTTAPPECALQLAHAAAALRDPRTALDIKHTLQPLATNFAVSAMSH